MFTITTKSGKEFETDYCIEALWINSTILYARVLNENLVTVAATFGDSDETSELVIDENGEARTIVGYTMLQSISNEGDAFKIMLMKG